VPKRDALSESYPEGLAEGFSAFSAGGSSARFRVAPSGSFERMSAGMPKGSFKFAEKDQGSWSK
jgi:hypothetical protein